MRTFFVSQGLITTDSNEKWHTSIGLYDGEKLLLDKLSNGTIDFDDKNVEAHTKKFDAGNNSYTKIDAFTVEFPGNKDLSINLLDDGEAAKTTNLKYITSSVTKSNIDGNQEGKLAGVTIDDQGQIKMTFSNKRDDIYGRIGIVDFINKNGLKKVGNNLFKEGYVVNKEGITYPSSGGAYVIWDKNGLLSTSVGQKTLETSNTDLTKGLTQLIVMQRSFSANSKAISTSDEMMQQAINLKS